MQKRCTAMKRIKTILMNTLIYWLQIIVYIWPSFFIGNGLVGLIVRILVNNQDNFLARLFETITCIIVLCAFLFVFAHRRGYKKGEVQYINLLISLILAAGMQLIYARIFRYAVYTTAGAYYFAHMLYAGSHQELTFAYYDVPAYMYIITMLIADCFYISTVILGEYLGKRKRLKERSALKANEQA